MTRFVGGATIESSLGSGHGETTDDYAATVQRGHTTGGGACVEIRKAVAIPKTHQVGTSRPKTTRIPFVVRNIHQIDICLRAQWQSEKTKQNRMAKPPHKPLPGVSESHKG